MDKTAGLEPYKTSREDREGAEREGGCAWWREARRRREARRAGQPPWLIRNGEDDVGS
jgi:hypothetical protein